MERVRKWNDDSKQNAKKLAVKLGRKEGEFRQTRWDQLLHVRIISPASR
jgi:hypothetical protein